MMKSILKPSRIAMCDLPSYTPMEQRPLMLPDNTEEVTLRDVEVSINRADRKRAIADYERADDATPKSVSFLPSTKTINLLACSTVFVFERDDPPMCIRMQAPVQESLTAGDLRDSFAARAVDIMLGVAMRGGAQNVARFGPGHLDTTLAEYHRVSGDEVMSLAELKDLMLQQLTDLLLRCEARIDDLDGKPQFDTRRKMKEMAQDAEYVTIEEEQDYEEAMINRKPDVLTQRYLRQRVGAKVVGLDANRSLLRAIQVMLSAKLLGNKAASD